MYAIVDHSTQYCRRYAYRTSALRTSNATEVRFDVNVCIVRYLIKLCISFLWERFITLYNYWGVSDLTPAHLGLFEGTPVSKRSSGADHPDPSVKPMLLRS